MTNKLVTAFTSDGSKYRSLEEAVTVLDSSGFTIEGIRRYEGQDSNGLYAGAGFGFNTKDSQVYVVTVEYKVTEEYVFSLINPAEEQDNGNIELEGGDVVRPSEPESDSGLDEGVGEGSVSEEYGTVPSEEAGTSRE